MYPQSEYSSHILYYTILYTLLLGSIIYHPYVLHDDDDDVPLMYNTQPTTTIKHTNIVTALSLHLNRFSYIHISIFYIYVCVSGGCFFFHCLYSYLYKGFFWILHIQQRHAYIYMFSRFSYLLTHSHLDNTYTHRIYYSMYTSFYSKKDFFFFFFTLC